MQLSKLVAPRLKTRRNFESLNSLKTSKLLEELSFLSNFSGEGYVKLPLATNVERHIRNFLENEVRKMGYEEVNLPVFQSIQLWEKSGRFDTFKDSIFICDNKSIFPTTEEPVAAFLSNIKLSYKELPLFVYGFRTLFRRTEETLGARSAQFQILDMYSVEPSEQNLESTIESTIIPFFRNTFKKMGVQIYPTQKGSDYLDFRLLTDEGDDKIYVRKEGNQILTFDKKDDSEIETEEKRSFSVGVVMNMRTRYSQKFGLTYISHDNSKKLAHLGGYAIGIERLFYSLVDQRKVQRNDSLAIQWPESMSPFDCAVIPVDSSHLSYCGMIYERLKNMNLDVLFDDTPDRLGIKTRRAYAVGIPTLFIAGAREKENSTVTIETLEGYRQSDFSLDNYVKSK